ncbi:MAG TPA: AlpA family phage regulatory protein [Candidimonas sp.]|nr:AlpA family phage regulatory protein [Candidimonas sp.]
MGQIGAMLEERHRRTEIRKRADVLKICLAGVGMAEIEQKPMTILPEGLYRWETFAPHVPLSQESWRQRVHDGRAPKPIKLSGRCTAWRGSDILQWLSDPTDYRACG